MRYPPHQCCWGFRRSLLYLMSKLRSGVVFFFIVEQKVSLALVLNHSCELRCFFFTILYSSNLHYTVQISALCGDCPGSCQVMCRCVSSHQLSLIIVYELMTCSSTAAFNKATWLSNAVIAPVELDQRRQLLMGQAPSHPLLLNDKNLKTTDVINALFSEFGLQSNSYFHSS